MGSCRGEGIALSQFVSTPHDLSSADTAKREAAVDRIGSGRSRSASELGSPIINMVSAHAVRACSDSQEIPRITTKPLVQKFAAKVSARRRLGPELRGLRRGADASAPQHARRRGVDDDASSRTPAAMSPTRRRAPAARARRTRRRLAINFDPSHTFPIGDFPNISVYRLGKKIMHCHVSDNDGVTNVHWRPGMGKIDWTAMFQALKDVGYDGVISIELEDVPGVSRGPNSSAPGVYRQSDRDRRVRRRDRGGDELSQGHLQGSRHPRRLSRSGGSRVPASSRIAILRKERHVMHDQLVYVGTYSEPILFGTGTGAAGPGQGHLRVSSSIQAPGSLALSGITEGVRNSSYLAFDPGRTFLYCVNEFKEYEGQASGAVSAFRIDPADRRSDLPQHQGEPRHRSLPPRRGRDGPQRPDRQFRERQRLRAADPGGRIARRCVRFRPASWIERRSAPPSRPACSRRDARTRRTATSSSLTSGMDKVIDYAFDATAESSRRIRTSPGSQRYPAPVHDRSSCTRTADRSRTSSTSSTPR